MVANQPRPFRMDLQFLQAAMTSQDAQTCAISLICQRSRRVDLRTTTKQNEEVAATGRNRFEGDRLGHVLRGSSCIRHMVVWSSFGLPRG
jgi:hypothetical protein